LQWNDQTKKIYMVISFFYMLTIRIDLLVCSESSTFLCYHSVRNTARDGP